jgi:hypothetical protein
VPRNGRVLRRAAQRHGTCQRPEAKGGIALTLADHFLRAFGASDAKIEGYKIVNGEKQWMGTLLCDYRSAEHVLTCVPKEGKPSDWTFQIKDGTRSGTLVLPESKTLYRKMSLKRIRKGT